MESTKMRLDIRKFLALTAALCCTVSPLFAQQNALWSEAPTKEGDYIARDFKFSAGQTLPEIRLHYTTLGSPRDESRRARVAHSFLRRRALRPRSIARCLEILSDSSRSTRRRPGKILETERRPASQISALRLFRHGARLADFVEGRIASQSPASVCWRVHGLHGRFHVGRIESRRYGRDAFAFLPAGRSRQPQSHGAQDHGGRHPPRSGVGQRQLHAATLRFARRARASTRRGKCSDVLAEGISHRRACRQIRESI